MRYELLRSIQACSGYDGFCCRYGISLLLYRTIAYRYVDLFMTVQIARMYSICLKFANCVSEIIVPVCL